MQIFGGAQSDPHLRRWMLFVDGENFTLRAQALAEMNGLTLGAGRFYQRDVFLWMPETLATLNIYHYGYLRIQDHAIRAHYYTSAVGDEAGLDDIREALKQLGFQPFVFKKTRQEQKAKGVDIMLAKDLLSHAFFNNYDIAVLIAGDGDYVPLIEEVKRLGKVVYLAFFPQSGLGLSDELRLAVDCFINLHPYFIQKWRDFITGERH